LSTSDYGEQPEHDGELPEDPAEHGVRKKRHEHVTESALFGKRKSYHHYPKVKDSVRLYKDPEPLVELSYKQQEEAHINAGLKNYDKELRKHWGGPKPKWFKT